MSRDDLYSLPMQNVGSFVFDEQVVRVFPDMIARSVPGYASILSMIEQLAARYVKPGTSVYDLGCSLGAATRLIRRQVPSNCVIHAVDNSSAMLNRLREILLEDSVGLDQTTQTPIAVPEVLLTESDILDVNIHNASFVVLNLTLQFIDPDQRSTLIRQVYDGLLPGGALLLSEKVCFDDSIQQDLMTELHHDFKRSHGYSDLEIAQKRTAIENRLIPETLDCHVTRLKECGFRVAAPWFQCFDFVSILAVRSD